MHEELGLDSFRSNKNTFGYYGGITEKITDKNSQNKLQS